jgi:hypothetical protein
MKTQVLTNTGLIVYDQEMKGFIDKKLEDKVEKVDGKGLSTNDYNDEEKNTVAQNKEDIEKLKKEFDTTDTNNDIITTTESTLENSKEGGLLINEIRGKTEQNASNPSVSSPQEIKSVVINTIKTTGENNQEKEIIDVEIVKEDTNLNEEVEKVDIGTKNFFTSKLFLFCSLNFRIFSFRSLRFSSSIFRLDFLFSIDLSFKSISSISSNKLICFLACFSNHEDLLSLMTSGSFSQISSSIVILFLLLAII